ncbi:MAG: GAF domain-containing protein [Chloroflexi bacterium]|nr:GAF domain-containing protein [Chloroflexota bacterium]
MISALTSKLKHRFPHRWWLRRGELYVYRLTAILIIVAATVYYWDSTNGVIWNGFIQPWQWVLNLGALYIFFYWVAEELVRRNQISWAIKFTSPKATKFHIVFAYFGVIVFTALYNQYLSHKSNSYSTWPLFIYPMMLTSINRKEGATPWPLLWATCVLMITGTIESQRLGWAILVRAWLWILVFGSLIHYFLRLQIDMGNRIAILDEVSNKLMRLQHNDSYYQEVVNLIGEMLEFPIVHLITLGPHPGMMVVRACYGKERALWDEVEIPIGRSITGISALNRRIQRWDNVNNCHYYFPAPGYENVKSEVCVPIYSGDGTNELFGVLDAQSDELSLFTEGDEHTLMILADALGIALAQENVTLRVQKAVDESWDCLSELDTTNEIFSWLANFIGKELKPDLISCHSLMIGTGYPRPVPYLWPEDDNPSRRSGYYFRSNILDIPRNAENAVTNMVATWTPYFQSDVRKDRLFNPSRRSGNFQQDSFVERERICSTAFLPIGVEENRLGAIFVNYRQPHTFSHVEASILKALAQAAAPHLLRAQKIWQIYQGFDRPELHIHELIHDHNFNMKGFIKDLRDHPRDVDLVTQRVNDLEQEMTSSSRQFLLAVSGQRLSLQKNLLSQNLLACVPSLSSASNYRIQYSIDVAPRVEAISPECKLILYRIANEAMNNTTRHGDATYCIVKIWQNRSELIMEILQDGEGFIPQNTAHSAHGVFFLLELAHEHLGATHSWLPEGLDKKTGLRIVFPVLPNPEELFHESE